MPDPFPPDDPSIPDDELLYIRIFPRADNLQPIDGGGYRPASGTLRRDEPLSVDLSSLSTPQATRDRDINNAFHVAAFSAAVARANSCRVVRDPLPENPAHGLVIGDHESGNGSMTKGQTKKIARSAVIVSLHPAAPLPA
jgi:hypothetical protein